MGTQGGPVRPRPGTRPVDVPLAQLVLHRPVAVPAQFPVEVHARHLASDPGRVPGLAGLSDRRVRGEHRVLQLRNRPGSGIRPFRGLRADAAVSPRSHRRRRVDPRERPEFRRPLRQEVDRTPIPRCTRDQRRLPRLAGPTADGSSLLRVLERLRRPRAVHRPRGISRALRNPAQRPRRITGSSSIS